MFKIFFKYLAISFFCVALGFTVGYVIFNYLDQQKYRSDLIRYEQEARRAKLEQLETELRMIELKASVLTSYYNQAVINTEDTKENSGKQVVMAKGSSAGAP